ASDGWSTGVMAREISRIYRAFASGLPSPLPALPMQYADFAAWQRRWLAGEVLEAELAYWKQQLAGLPPILELPFDRPRPVRPTHRGETLALELPPELPAALKSFALREGATPFMLYLAAFQALLSRATGQDDVAVGSPVAGRNRQETETLIGFFANTLVLRGNLAGDPRFREFLGRARETALGAQAHQDLPFERLVEELQPQRSPSRTPLFQVMLVLQNAAGGDEEL